MTNLTQISYYARRAINWTILIFIALMLLRLFWNMVMSLSVVLFPVKPPPPNHAFGKLPALKFPAVASPSGEIVFKLETIEGTVPRASDSAVVYFMPKSAANLLALSQTQKFVEKFNFSPNPIVETRNIYRFEDPQNPYRRIRYDLISGNFVIRYAFDQDQKIFASGTPPTAEAAKTEAKQLLQNHSLYPEDFRNGVVVATLLQLTQDQLVMTTSYPEAKAIRVDFWRQTVNGLSVYPPFPDEGHISLILTGSTDPEKRIIQLAYTYWPVDYKISATYKLKTGEQAWQELINGAGFIARYPTGNSAEIVVRNMSLGYYDSFEPQTYLQPIFVFTGDDGFIGYVPAVSPPWIE